MKNNDDSQLFLKGIEEWDNDNTSSKDGRNYYTSIGNQK